MADRDEPSGTSSDPDDWFSDEGPRPSAPPSRRPPRGEEAAEPAWVEDETREATGPPPPPAGLPRWRFALLGAAAFVALVLIAFAASGLFSSDKKSTSSTATTTLQQPTTTAQSTSPATTTTTTPTTPTTPEVPTLPTGLLKQGTSGNEVKALQQALQAAGQSPGTIDGVFGPQTQQALIAFQQSAGIPADGVYGPATKAALEKQLNAG